jgi:hypothetical protein
MPDGGQSPNPSDSECYTPSSGPFRIHMQQETGTFTNCSVVCSTFGLVKTPPVLLFASTNTMKWLSEEKPYEYSYFITRVYVGAWKLPITCHFRKYDVRHESCTQLPWLHGGWHRTTNATHITVFMDVTPYILHVALLMTLSRDSDGLRNGR